MIVRMRIKSGLKSRFERLRAERMLTLDEMAQLLGICTKQLNDKNQYRLTKILERNLLATTK